MKLLNPTLFTVLTAVLVTVTPATQASDAITRAEFFELVVEELEVPTFTNYNIDESVYGRIPAYIKPEVDALLRRDALRALGQTIAPNRTITRGEAARIVVELQGLQNSQSVNFRDVQRGTLEDKAIRVVVAKQWLLPLQPRYFGVERLLTQNEARLFIGRITGKYLPTDTDASEPAIVPTTPQSITVKLPSKDEATDLPKEDIVETIWQIISEDYLYKEKIQEEEAGYLAIEALVNSLDDDYTTFMRPREADNFAIQLNGRVTGIGAQVENRNGVVTIVAPLPGSPAEQSGLLPNDQIIEVDGESLLDFSYPDAVNKVRGPRGSVARLKVRRNSSEIYFNVQREVVRVPDFEIDWQDNIAVITLMQFGQIAKTDLRKSMMEVAEKNPHGIILDLRNNPGGLLDAAGTVVGTVVPKGSVYAKIKSRNKTSTNETIDEPIISENVPLYVLVNGGSASASEIVAGALQDLNRAKVIGQTTFGKGTVQQVIQFTDGSNLKMTIAEWYTPNDRKIDGLGIEPDYTVELSDDRDAVLLKALELLR